MRERRDFFIEPGGLAARLEEKPGLLKIVDGSWYLPAMNRDAKAEYQQARIPGAVHFDIDRIADPASGLPHMLPAPETFAREAGKLGLSDQDKIVVYDGPGMFSAARVWWTLRVMGACDVRILEGGFDQWQAAGLPVASGAPAEVSPNEPETAVFTPRFEASRIRNYEEMLANIRRGESLVLDARPYDRFTGKSPEPRAGLASGHIPGSRSLPASDLVRDGRLIDGDELAGKLRETAADRATHVTTSCGSGVTAAILTLALELCGHDHHALYDGSWADWGSRQDAPVARWA